MSTNYNAIVVGARCAGSPTAMLLARKGYKVLLIDKVSFPSDTISTHIVWPTGSSLLKKWGLLDQVVESGAPKNYVNKLDLGSFSLSGHPTPYKGQDWWVTPRRTVLDKILVDAAIKAGVDFEDNASFEDVVTDKDKVTGIKYKKKNGDTVTVHARIVIGADGRNSHVARKVNAPTYNEIPSRSSWYYSYWSDLPTEMCFYSRQGSVFGMLPTNDDLTLVATACKPENFKEFRSDIEGNYLKTLSQSPELADRLSQAKRVDKFYGMSENPNYFHKPYGPGWALVGDAGYHRDPITGQGISDSFFSAELLTDAISSAFSGKESMDDALTRYQQQRDEAVMPMYGFTCDFAKLEPAPPHMQELFLAMKDNQEATDRFMGAITGTYPIPEFFAPENIERIMGAVSREA